MGWSVRRTGVTLHIEIQTPVGDWEALLDAVHEQLGDRVSAIVLPSVIPEGSKTDAELLGMLWDALGSLGLTLRPSSAPA